MLPAGLRTSRTDWQATQVIALGSALIQHRAIARPSASHVGPQKLCCQALRWVLGAGSKAKRVAA
jgi:hypothetical protein